MNVNSFENKYFQYLHDLCRKNKIHFNKIHNGMKAHFFQSYQ